MVVQLDIDDYTAATSASVLLRAAAERASARGERRFADELHSNADKLETMLIKMRAAARANPQENHQ